MATFALQAECTFVNIVADVTTGACGGNLRRAGTTGQVTLIAARLEVGTVQREIGVAGVIKLAEAPVAGVVAALAIDSQRTLVGIIGGMTAVAGVLGVTVQRRGMALVARHHAMRPQQHKSDPVVIEVRGLPRGFVVAVGAGLAQLALVRVVLAVTARAIR